MERSVRQGCPLSPLLYVLALEPLLRRLRDEGTCPPLRGIKLIGSVRAKISTVGGREIRKCSRCQVQLWQKRRLSVGYLEVGLPPARALPLGWPSRPHPWGVGGVWVWKSGRVWLRRWLSLKGRAEVCAAYIFPLIIYRLSVLPLPKDHQLALFELLWVGRSPLVLRQVCYQRPRDGGLGIPDLESLRLAERLAYLGRPLTTDAVWSLKVRVTFPYLRSNPKAEGRRRPRDEAQFVSECRRAIRNLSRSSELSRSRKELYRGLVVGSASDPLVKQFCWSVAEVRSQWNWAPGSGFLNNSEFSLTWRRARNALALHDWDYRACLTDMPDCLRCGSGLEETALHAFYYCEWLRPFWSHVKEWTARISSRELVLLDVG